MHNFQSRVPSSAPGGSENIQSPSPDRSSLWRLDATGLAEGFRAKRFTPVDALDACLVRVGALQPGLNAFVALDEEGARAAAAESARRWDSGSPLSALDGVPVSIKDNLHAAGLPTRWGSAITPSEPVAHDEAPVALLRAAGAVIFGKTNVPEFAMQGITDNELFGPTRNPWREALTPGGSSGGAAAAVAAGCGPLALATDGGGSIRRPADHCGIVGFKPGRGCVRRAGGLPTLFLDHEVAGPLARSVRDIALALSVLAPAAPASPRIARVLLTSRFGDNPVDPCIAKLLAGCGPMLRAAGLLVEERDSVVFAEAVNAGWPLLPAVGLAWLEDILRQPPYLGSWHGLERAGSLARETLARGRAATAADFFSLQIAIEALEGELSILFEKVDAIVTPVAAALPWPIGDNHPPVIDGRPVGPRGHAVFTAFANAAGLPALALPIGFVRGLPVGLQIVGRPGTDRAVLELGAQLEAVCNRRILFPNVDAGFG